MRILVIGVCGLMLTGCYTLGNDEGEKYLQRKEGVTLSAGDASRVNAMTHAVNPWPQGVGDRRIPTNAPRMVQAITNYNCPTPKQGAPQTTTQSQTQATGPGASVTNSTTQLGNAPSKC